MNINDMKNVAENTTQNAKEFTSDTSKEIVKSSKDWIKYIQKHPLQSVLFGIVGYYALKGVIKD